MRNAAGRAGPTVTMLDRLLNLDRRWVFAAMALAVAAPVLIGAKFPEKPSAMTRRVFDAVEDLRGDPGLIEDLADPLGDAGLHDAGVTDDQRARRADALDVIRERGDAAIAEHDGGGEAPGNGRHRGGSVERARAVALVARTESMVSTA